MKGVTDDERNRHAARARLVLFCALMLILALTALSIMQAFASENRFPVESDESSFPEGAIEERDRTVRLELEMDDSALRKYGVSKKRLLATIKESLAGANISFSEEKSCPVLYFTCYVDPENSEHGLLFGVDARRLSPRKESEYIEDWSLGDARQVVKNARQIYAAVKRLVKRLPLPYGQENKSDSADPLT